MVRSPVVDDARGSIEISSSKAATEAAMTLVV
jgi:hypothetical protein